MALLRWRLQAVLGLLKSATPRPLITADAPGGDDDSGAAEDAIDVMFSCVVRARCRRQDVTGALAEVAEMDETPGRPPVGAKVFKSLLEACAIPRPPLSREAEAVWVHAKVRGIICVGGGDSGSSAVAAAAAAASATGF